MVYRLCPHPNCPITFKSQRGQTYHICTVHSRPLHHPINVQQYDGSVHEDLDDDYQHADHGSNSESDNALEDLNQNGPSLRNEHPHLTGMCMPL